MQNSHKVIFIIYSIVVVIDYFVNRSVYRLFSHCCSNCCCNVLI